MTPLFKKLNFKDQPTILAMNAPTSFQVELTAMSDLAEIKTDPMALEEIAFAIVFVTAKKEIEQHIEILYPKMKCDPVVWFCYPKGTSKNYSCDFNRDNGWGAMGMYDLEPVRQVAIDADWSALRFRKIEYIKNFTRHKEMVLSEKGKKRVN